MVKKCRYFFLKMKAYFAFLQPLKSALCYFLEKKTSTCFSSGLNPIKLRILQNFGKLCLQLLSNKLYCFSDSKLILLFIKRTSLYK